MFCPLCKAEYREGFQRCNDCGIDLVASKSEADGTAVEVLWRGADERRLDEIFGALRDAGIPCNVKSTAGPDQVVPAAFSFGLSVLLSRVWPFASSLQRKAKRASRMDWEIRVLARQHAAARDIMSQSASR